MWVRHIQHFLWQWFHQLLYSVTVAFTAIKILPTVGADIPIERRFQSYLKPERRYASRHLSELTTIAFRAN